jgi:Integrase core domain
MIGVIHYYNHEDIKLKLKGLSPVQYRTQAFCVPSFSLSNFRGSVHRRGFLLFSGLANHCTKLEDWKVHANYKCTHESPDYDHDEGLEQA